VRQIREDAARAEFTARERAYLAAAQEARERQKALDEHLVWRKQEEDRRYQAILQRNLDLHELESFKEGIAALRNRDGFLREEAEKAREAEQAAASARDNAASALKQARKEKQKISAHRDIWQTGQKQEMQRLEDLEMEEFSGGKSPGRE
jgi:hypothetical protein